MEASEGAKSHEPSEVDAMGQDKRRRVVGQRVGPSRRSQLIFFAAAGAAIVVILGGWTLAVGEFDQPQDSYPNEAPWSAASAEQIPTRSPSGPCGEPGNAYPPAADSPCALQTSAKSTEREPTAPGQAQGRQEEGSGGVTGSGGEAGGETGASGQ